MYAGCKDRWVKAALDEGTTTEEEMVDKRGGNRQRLATDRYDARAHVLASPHFDLSASQERDFMEERG